jgi:hypothetical protein
VLSFLKDHPFAVAGHFDTSLVLTYSVQPSPLFDLYHFRRSKEKWGSIAVAMVRAKSLRPKGFMKFSEAILFLQGTEYFSDTIQVTASGYADCT